MELNTSAVTGAMKVGLQIVSALKRPSVEVFSELRKIDRPMQMFTGGLFAARKHATIWDSARKDSAPDAQGFRATVPKCCVLCAEMLHVICGNTACFVRDSCTSHAGSLHV